MAQQPDIEKEVQSVFALQRTLEETEQALMQNEQFRAFIELQKSFGEKSAAIWKQVEEEMLAHDIKSVKGDWGSLTIAERTNYKVTDISLLPAKFVKKVADTTKISQSHKLEGKLPRGVETSVTQYLTKRFK